MMMKKLSALLLAALLVFSLAACGGGEPPSAPAPQPQSPSSAGEPAPPAPSAGGSSAGNPAAQPKREWNLQPGKVIAYTDTEGLERLTWNTPYTNDGLWELGAEKEWEAFQTLLRTADVSYLEVSDRVDTEGELPVEDELKILQALENAQPDYFQEFENPAVGRNYLIGAYDPDGNQLFVVTYDGFWLTATFPREEGWGSCIFDGEKLELDLPSLEKYHSDAIFFGLNSGEVIPMDDERLTGPLAKRGYGTQADLDRWHDLIQTAAINRFVVHRTGTEPGELPVEIEGQLRTLLRDAEPALYPPETKEDPVTGGGVTILAYDEEGRRLFTVSYLGNWFTVRFGEEETEVIFNGETDENLNLLLTMDLV